MARWLVDILHAELCGCFEREYRTNQIAVKCSRARQFLLIIISRRASFFVQKDSSTLSTESTSPGQIIKMTTKDLHQPEADCWVLGRQYAVAAELHLRYAMPVLRCLDTVQAIRAEVRMSIMLSFSNAYHMYHHNVQLLLNVQHDCIVARCNTCGHADRDSGNRPQRRRQRTLHHQHALPCTALTCYAKSSHRI